MDKRTSVRLALALFAALGISAPAKAAQTTAAIWGYSSGIQVPLLATASGANYVLNTVATSVTGGQDVWSMGLTIANGQTTITGGSATLIAASSTTRRAITVRNDNTGTINVYLGTSAVTTSTGLTLVPGSAVTLSLSAGAALYAIQASGSPVVSWLTESN